MANDTRATATPLGVNGGIDGNIFGSDPRDYFVVTPQNDGSLTATLSGLSDDLDLILETESGSVLTGSYSWGSSSEEIEYDLNGGQAYYLEVTPFLSSESNYNLDLNYTADAGGDAADNIFDAETISPNTTINGDVFGADTDDFFRLSPASSGELDATLSGLSSDVDLYLLDSTGATIESSLNLSASDENITAQLNGGGTYYIQVAEFSGDSDYTLDLDFNDSPPSDDAPDTRFSANTVSLNTSLSGSIGNGDQYDVYRLEPSSNGEITASLTGLAADADLRILDSNGTVVASSLSYGSSDEEVSTSLSGDEEYFVEVAQWSGSTDYTLDLSYEPDSGSGDDVGDNISSAASVQPNSTHTGNIGGPNDPDDVYQIQPDSSGTLTATLSNLSSDIDLYLLGSNGYVLDSSINYGSADETVTRELSADQTYYVEVSEWSGESDYELDLDFNTDGDSTTPPGDGNDGPSGDGQTGTDGADQIEANPGADLIYGQDGADTIFGGDAGDHIYGNVGNDFIDGGARDDLLFGGQNGGELTPDEFGNMRHLEGTETLVGGAGNDLIYGNYGADDLEGETGNDTLFGGQGGDFIGGGPGDDIIWGNRGTDTMSGDDGADTFMVLSGGTDRITDFAPSEGDEIQTLAGFDDVRANDHPDGLELAWDRGSSSGEIIIEGLTPSDFSSDWLGAI